MAPAAVDVHDGVLMVEHWHLGGSAFRGADRRPFRSPTALARQSHDLRVRLTAQCCGRLARYAESLALLHRARHRRGVFRGGRVDRRLRTAPPARDDDHGDVHRCAHRRLRRRPDSSIAARAFRLAGDIRPGRGVPAGSGAGASAVAAGIAAVPGRQGEFCHRATSPCSSASALLRCKAVRSI